MPTPNLIRLGTRASQLAMWQSTWVQSQLQARGVSVELVPIRTDGDDQTQPLQQIGGQGLFTKRLQTALLEQEIDLAVHSLKDLPTQDHPELTIAAIPPRENRADALVSNRYQSLEELPTGAVIGTGSVRRSAQLLHLRPDLEIRDIRGNVDTRLRKLDEGQFDAIVLAVAGLNRLELHDRIAYQFSTSELLPAVGQGALGLETRANDCRTLDWVEPLNHLPSYYAALAERVLLRTLYAGCLSPVGCDTSIADGTLTLRGVVLSTDGRQRVFAEETGPIERPQPLGAAVAQRLLDNGAGELLAR